MSHKFTQIFGLDLYNLLVYQIKVRHVVGEWFLLPGDFIVL